MAAAPGQGPKLGAAAPAAPASGGQPGGAAAASAPSVHPVKRIDFLGRIVGVCLQNENGPCPLLALANILILRGLLELHKDRSQVTSAQLIELIANYLLEANPPREGADEAALLRQQTLSDVINVLPNLQVGLDVNVRFSGVEQFEFDSRISVFDMLGVTLLHGWVVDAKDSELFSALGQLSYNQAVDRLVRSDEIAEGQAENAGVSASPSTSASSLKELKDKRASGSSSSASLAMRLQEAERVRQFLDETAAQLTFAGLLQLHEVVRERELVAFFRNNHFSTMFKLRGQLYLLVTDVGYRSNDAVAWERLDSIDGNTEMVSPSFDSPNEYLDPSDLAGRLSQQRLPEGRLNADELLAMQIQQQENRQSASRQPPSAPLSPASQQQQQRRQQQSQQQHPQHARQQESEGLSCCVM
jgi:hypothetical protein